jgi:hypothetical protein
MARHTFVRTLHKLGILLHGDQPCRTVHRFNSLIRFPHYVTAEANMIPEFERRRQNHDPKESLEALAKDELRKSSYPEIRKVICEVRDNVVRLRGSVPTYFHKQVAQASLMKRISCGPRIENHLKVAGAGSSRRRTRAESANFARTA